MSSEAAAVAASTVEQPTLHDAHCREVSSVCFLNYQQSWQTKLTRSEVPPLTDSSLSFSSVSDSCLTHKSTYTHNSVVPLHESFLGRKRVLRTEATWVRGSKRLKSDIRVIVGT